MRLGNRYQKGLLNSFVDGNRENGFTSDRVGSGIPDFAKDSILYGDSIFFIGPVHGALTSIQVVPTSFPTPEASTLLLVSGGAMAALGLRRRTGRNERGL